MYETLCSQTRLMMAHVGFLHHFRGTMSVNKEINILQIKTRNRIYFQILFHVIQEINNAFDAPRLEVFCARFQRFF